MRRPIGKPWPAGALGEWAELLWNNCFHLFLSLVLAAPNVEYFFLQNKWDPWEILLCQDNMKFGKGNTEGY